MVDPVEDKGFLTERLEEDRQKMAVQVGELKRDYNVSRRLRASVQKYPWPWIMGAVLTGFLVSRLPARRKEIYLWSDPLQRNPPQEVYPLSVDKDQRRTVSKLWSLIKPIISTYLGREVYERMWRRRKQTMDRLGRIDPHRR
jgi:hypothetical protein